MATIAEAFQLAVREHQAGRLDTAAEICRRILQADPQQPYVHHLLGQIAHQRGDYSCALDSIRRAIDLSPGVADFHYSCGKAYADSGDLEQAEVFLRKAVDLDDTVGRFHNELGALLHRRRRFREAEECYQRAVALDPQDRFPHFNLGVLYRQWGKLAEAKTCQRTALRIAPQCAEVHLELGLVLQAQGRLEDALSCHLRSLELDPRNAKGHNNLGTAYRLLNRLDDAVDSFRRSLAIAPGNLEAHVNLARALTDQGDVDSAAASYRKAARLRQGDRLLELRASLLCPPVFQSDAEIDAYRERAWNELQQFQRVQLRVSLDELSKFGSEPPFAWQYHDRNNRQLKESHAGVFRNCFSSTAAIPGTGKPRIGFVVTYKHERAFLKSMGGIIGRMNPQMFDVVIVCSDAGSHRIGTTLRGCAVRVLPLPGELEGAIEEIRRARFDLLYYWEVGTDSINYFLPFARLAPVQCTSWGVQVTSGIPAMDYYLSSELVESHDADDHYSEALVRLKTLPSYQFRACLPDAPKGRADFGFSENQHLYLCAQRPEKIHPDMDELLAEILRRDDNGMLVLTEDQHGYVTRQLQSRFDSTVAGVRDRIRFLPSLPNPDFLALVSASDVMLDPLYFGGVNTSYDAFSFGKPVVTLPSRFQRGRYTLGCYRKMGILDCVASSRDHYVEIAVELGTDEDRRISTSRRILDKSRLLFEDEESVDEHVRVFEQLIERARSH